VTTQKRATFLTVILLLTLTAIIVGISLWINRSIARPIVKLEEDTQIIGSGNLDYKVGTTAKDEIGHLSRAFDKMTVNLKETTASIAELNREISERKQAEVTLRASEEKYAQWFCLL
jgi:nitrogen fixation/metabolism regulation signal transduction histidine kinase